MSDQSIPVSRNLRLRRRDSSALPLAELNIPSTSPPNDSTVEPPLIQSLGRYPRRSDTPAPAVVPNSEPPARLLRQHLARNHKVALTDDLVRTTKRSGMSRSSRSSSENISSQPLLVQRATNPYNPPGAMPSESPTSPPEATALPCSSPMPSPTMPLDSPKSVAFSKLSKRSKQSSVGHKQGQPKSLLQSRRLITRPRVGSPRPLCLTDLSVPRLQKLVRSVVSQS